jgi:hypothetical protein
MGYDYSAVCLVPADKQEIGNRLAEGLGHGPNNYSVPLSGDGSLPATHYGCRAQVNEVFVAMVQSASTGDFPEIEGMTQVEILEAFSNMSIDIQQGIDAYSHFTEYAASMGLIMVTEEDDE